MIRTVHSHFEYKGLAIPIVLGGCSKLHSVTLDFHQTVGQDANNKVMGHVFHGISGVSAVKEIKVDAFMWSSQSVWSPLQATARPSGLFRNLRHLTYDVTFVAQHPNSQSGILQLAQYLAFAPQLETLEVHMTYLKSSDCWIGEGISYCMRRHDHLKTVYMSGFQCFRPEVELLYVILDMGAALEHVTIEPRMRNYANSLGKPRYKICEWADRTSQRFGKVITVVE
ncbi:putative F-box/LRR-repeat protein [Hordeum vulgare]|nr:putative F-box/LRR-repeat protein [Hordeum vulgare]